MLVGRYGREPKLSYPSRKVDTGEIEILLREELVN